MSVFRVRFAVQGGHVHCALFAAPGTNMTFAKCGDFVVRKGEEMKALVAACGGVDFIGQDERVGLAIATAEDR